MSPRSKMNPRLYRFLFSSPWLPLLFIGLFILSIYAEFARIPVPRFSPTPRKMILINNICFLALIALRFINQMTRLKRDFRYDSGDRPGSAGQISPLPPEALAARLSDAGFRMGPDGYGEKRTFSLPATAVIYGGLFLALLVGSYDNLRHFSGVFFQGEGAPSPLDDPGLYFNVTQGPLSSLKGMPRLQVRKVIYGDPQWPKGAVEIALSDRNNAMLVQGMVAKEGKPLVYKGLEYHLGRFLADVPLMVVTDNLHLEYEGTVKVQPLDPPQGSYTYYANFKGHRLLWDVLYDPEHKSLKLLGGKEGKNVVNGVYQFGRDTAVPMGSYIVKVPWLAEWTEIHVVRPRHMVLVSIGALLAVIGILMRLVYRPQRVWLEQAPEGCRVWTVGGEAEKVLKVEG